jgi:DNA-directed RNA polymerase subunit F
MSEKLRTEPQIEDPDEFYARLIDLHDGLSPAESSSLNCKLILLMANHIGDQDTLDEVLEVVRNYRPPSSVK